MDYISRIILGITVLLYSFTTFGQGDIPIIKQFTIYHENDALFPVKNGDNSYTGGLRVAFVTDEIPIWQPFIKLERENSKFYNFFNVGFTSFTPKDIAAPEIQFGDRPYASYTFFSIGRIQLYDRAALYSELSIGALGLDYAEKAQTYIHENKFLGSDRPVPRGWGNQIENGGSLAINYKVDFLHIIKNVFNTNVIIPSYRVAANLGNYISDVYVGTQLSFFNINYSTAALNFNEVLTFKKQYKRKTRFNLFIEPGLRWNIYNATLQGALFSDNSVYTIPRDQVRTFALDLNLGANLIINDMFVLKYTLTRRSQEFSEGKFSHWWGGLGLGAQF